MEFAMKRIFDYFMHWSAAFADVVLLGFAWRIFANKYSSGAEIEAARWLLLLTAVLMINFALRGAVSSLSGAEAAKGVRSRKNNSAGNLSAVSVNALICVNAVLTLASAYIGGRYFVVPRPPLPAALLMAAFAAVSVVHTAILAEDKPRQDRLALTLDVTLAATAASIAISHTPEGDAADALSLAGTACCVCLFAALAAFRLKPSASRAAHGGGRGLFAAIGFAGGLILAAAALLTPVLGGMKPASEGIAGGFSAFFSGIGSFFAGFADILERFLTWLLALLNIQGGSYSVTEEGPAAVAAEGGREAASPAGLIFVAVIAVCMLAGLIGSMVRLRGKRLRVVAGADDGSEDGSRSGTGGILMIFKELFERARYAFSCARYRNTPAGLFLRTERRFRRGELKKAVHETPPGYLRRLACCVEGRVHDAAEGRAEERGQDAAEGRAEERVQDAAEGRAKERVQAAVEDRAKERGQAAADSRAASFRTLADILEKQYYRGEQAALPGGFARKYIADLKHVEIM